MRVPVVRHVFKTDAIELEVLASGNGQACPLLPHVVVAVVSPLVVLVVWVVHHLEDLLPLINFIVILSSKCPTILST
jgi:hypothetical protein